ncbi:6-phosphofructokinase [Ornithinimicrobium pekingense]|uniref:6-phosphofructokinase n=1 Tax=Ornithinimicrobium pekingense TaxID=384677 RepID=A0ABQ2F679_9MICO|nr:6-phosphofructokinase [Ornithinimicrobium pekingense]GGK66063.1 6-phosphofructokinase [Ornithinimicrobium pekingense]
MTSTQPRPPSGHPAPVGPARASGADGPRPARVGILTSGGDSQGMNAAVRAVVRTTLTLGGEAFAVHEGWAGAVAGGAQIRQLGWDDVAGVLHRGGTVLGTARCAEFRDRAGRRAAAGNLVRRGIDRLVVIGGDGSLRGAEELRREWPTLLDELVASGEVSGHDRLSHPRLRVAGLVGSIDNDMAGTEMTIGADSALHRICAALDGLRSTAASHQRTFVVEVMGRHCGYLALMAAVAGGADAALVPEAPPAEGWQDLLVRRLQASRAAGLRDLIVIVAEGAVDRLGRPVRSADVGTLLTERLGGEGSRVTVLGHVQRGGRPSAYDRWMPTLLGHAAAQEVLGDGDLPAVVVGVRSNRVTLTPLPEAVRAVDAVREAAEKGDFDVARAARGRSFATLSASLEDLCTPPGLLGAVGEERPTAATALVGGASTGGQGPGGGDGAQPVPRARRVGVLHAGGPAPGMNAVVRALVRSAAVGGTRVVGVVGSVPALVSGPVRELGWAEVDDWIDLPGAELGSRRTVLRAEDAGRVAATVAEHRLDALVLVGGIEAYRSAAVLDAAAAQHPALRLPTVCLPAAIDNNLPGTDLSVGADTALNTVVEALDRLRSSASAARRCFVVETMGGPCGYLPMMAGMAAGAERVYLPEDRITIHRLARDAGQMTEAFAGDRTQWLAIRGDQSSASYTADVLARIFEQEGGDLFDVRQTVLGHVQQGGVPTPFDRLLATRLAQVALAEVDRRLAAGQSGACLVGEVGGRPTVTPIDRLEVELDDRADRPRRQWWLELRTVHERVGGRAARA